MIWSWTAWAISARRYPTWTGRVQPETKSRYSFPVSSVTRMPSPLVRTVIPFRICAAEVRG